MGRPRLPAAFTAAFLSTKARRRVSPRKKALRTARIAIKFCLRRLSFCRPAIPPALLGDAGTK